MVFHNSNKMVLLSSQVIFVVCSLLLASVYGLSTKKVHVNYPAELLLPVTGSSFQANVTQDKLLCFGNRDYNTPTYIETLYCMLPYFPGTTKYCNSVWGSRTVEVEASGSIEFLRVTKLPHETSSTILHGDHLDSSYAVELSATRWLEMDSNRQHGMKYMKKILQIPAEPLYLCARSTNWQGASSSFQMKFRPAHLRSRDKRHSNDQTLVHCILIMAVTSAWLIPYVAALAAAVLAYEHAIKVMLTLFVVSTSVVCLTPLMLTKSNRNSARLYFNYFFTRTQAQETRIQIKKRLPVFQALFFSSAVIFFGFGAIYVAYYYDFMQREVRNACFKGTLSLAISWFTFSFCRSFERFFRDWLWIAVSVSLAHMLDKYLNPMCRNEVVVATMVISQLIRLIIPHIVKFEFINTLVSSALPQLQNVSSKLRIPLPYQIYEHHSLRHLVESEHIMSTQNSPGADGEHLGVRNDSHSRDTLYHHSVSASSSRVSLTQMTENQSHGQSQKHLQPLVDYIDEVMEGSICPDEEDVDEFQLEGSGSEFEDANISVSIGGNKDGDMFGEEDEGDASAGRFRLERSNDGSSGKLSRKGGSLVSGGGASFCEVARGGGDGGTGPLWMRLQPPPVLLDQNSDAPAGVGSGDSKNSTSGSMEQRNRTALLQSEGISLSDLPSFTSVTSAAHVSPVQVQVHVQEPPQQQEGEKEKMEVEVLEEAPTARRSTRRSDKKNAAPDAPPYLPAKESDHHTLRRKDMAANALLSSSSKPASPPQWSNNLVGAEVTPLHLVGPLTLHMLRDGPISAGHSAKSNSSNTSASASASRGAASSKKIRSVKANKDGVTPALLDAAAKPALVPALQVPSCRAWLPLATHDSALVSGLQRSCDLLCAPVECRMMAPVQDTMVFSATLHFDSPAACCEDVLQCVLDLDRNKENLHTVMCSAESLSAVVETILAHIVPADVSLKCVLRGDSAVVQLSLPTAGVLCSLLALVHAGKAALRRILNHIRQYHPFTQHSSAVLVNHLPLTSLERLLPCAHHVSLQCSLQLPSADHALSLIDMHHKCDRYEASAYIISAIRALLHSCGADVRYADAAAHLVVDMHPEVACEGRVFVRGRVPVLLAQYECDLATQCDSVSAKAAKRCLSLLSGDVDAHIVGSVCNVALFAYISYLKQAE